MKPLSSCALFGAVRALAGIKDALILQHSVGRCRVGQPGLSDMPASLMMYVRPLMLFMMRMLLMAVRRFCVKPCRRQSVFLRIAVRYL